MSDIDIIELLEARMKLVHNYPADREVLKLASDEIILLRKELTKLQKESVKQRFALIEIQCKAQDILRPVPFQEDDDEN